MGVEHLYGQWIVNSKYPNVQPNKLPKKIHGLLLDANGIIHATAQKVFGYGDNVDPRTVALNATLKDKDLHLNLFIFISFWYFFCVCNFNLQ